MAVHRMHLKGPWTVRWLDREAASFRAALPAEWRNVFGDEAGRAEFLRKFHQPTNLEPHEHVWIVFDGVGGQAVVRLNGETLGVIAQNAVTAEFEINQQLGRHNELAVELAFDPGVDGKQPGGLWGPVALEIRFDEHDVGQDD